MSTVSIYSRPNPPKITLEELGRDIARRKAAYEAKYGKPFEMPRNAGLNRTESKKALLAAINEASEKQGWRW